MQLKIFFWQAGTCLKFILQNIFLKTFCSQTVIFYLSRTGINKNERIQAF